MAQGDKVVDEAGSIVGIDMGDGYMAAVVPIFDRHRIPAEEEKAAKAAADALTENEELRARLAAMEAQRQAGVAQENDELRARLAALEAQVAAPPATDSADKVDAASGDTNAAGLGADDTTKENVQ